MASQYKKQYLPGYTGFVPQKKEIFGCSQGDVNRIVTNQLQKPAVQDISPMQAKRLTRSLYSSPQRVNENAEQLLLSNQSKHGSNWIGGPNQDTRAQYIPGYSGYVPNIKSETIIGKSFAKTSADSLNNQFSKGHDIPNTERFKSSNQANFNKASFRRLGQQVLDPAQSKDVKDIQQFSDYEQVSLIYFSFQGIPPKKTNIYMEMPTVGYSGHQSPHRKTSPQIYNRKSPEFNIGALGAKIKYTDMDSLPEYQQMSDNFKKATITKKNIPGLGEEGQQPINIPIVGYQGHRKGVKAQGFYGKSFRDTAIQSKVVEAITQ